LIHQKRERTDEDFHAWHRSRQEPAHGARAAPPGLAQSDTPLGRWLKGLLERTHRNVATVALANKLARIAWAVLAHDRRFGALHIGG
jgi:hypothetical protein